MDREKRGRRECNTYQPGIGGRILQTDSGYLGKHRHSCPYGLVSNVVPYAGRDDENGNPGIIGRGMESSARHGAALEKKFREKIANISLLLEKIAPYEKERVEKVKERITDALEKTLSVDYDKNRLEQELIYYIEKLDVNEEKQRLGNHLKYFISTMESGNGQGKKLGFIAQEMGREINTLGSKSNHAEMQKIVVQMKDELEQIKEQVLNVM